MRKCILILVVTLFMLSFSSCITMMLLNNAIQDKAYDERGCSNSVFTVAKGRTVRFSRANIYGSYSDPSKYSKRYGEEKYGTGWYFEQDCFHGNGSGSADGKYLFGECDNVRLLYGGKIVEDYRLLTAEEWDYLLFKRTASTIGGVENARFVISKVGIKRGMIIFPDKYKHPRGVPEIFGANDISGLVLDNSFDEREWDKMENAGAVFLIEPYDGTLGVAGYLTSSKNGSGQVGFMRFETIISHFVDIGWLPDNRKGLARLVVDN